MNLMASWIDIFFNRAGFRVGDIKFSQAQILADKRNIASVKTDVNTPEEAGGENKYDS